jgi:DNA-binding response OmpR family regulator
MRQNMQVALQKAKRLIGATDRILAKRENCLVTSDDGWIMPRILIVEDDLPTLNLVSKILSGQGYDTVLAENGEKALEILQCETFDLMISDLVMPRVNGIELLEKIYKSHAEIPVIILTGFNTIGSAIEAIKLGAFDFMKKPFKLPELLLTVQRALEHNNMYRGECLKALMNEEDFMSPAMRSGSGNKEKAAEELRLGLATLNRELSPKT